MQKRTVIILRRCPSSTHSTSHRGMAEKTRNSEEVIISYVVKTMWLIRVLVSQQPFSFSFFFWKSVIDRLTL